MKRFLIRFFAFILCILMLSSCTGNGIRPEETETDIPSTATDAELERYSLVYYDYFDTVCTVVGYGNDEAKFKAMCDEVEERLAFYDKNYDIYHSFEGMNNLQTLNLYAKERPIEVSKEIIDLLLFCKKMYVLTKGMTNIAMGSVLTIWHQYREDGINDPENAKVPPMDELQEAAKHCNIDDIVIDEENMTVFFKDPKLKIDIGAVAKGYATEMIARKLMEEGYDMVALNFGGNIRVIGGKNDGSPWAAGVQNPDLLSDQKYLVNVGLTNTALVTSGTYQRYYYVGNIKYHHIINPDTLMPVRRFDSVSILTPDSGLADALSTACFNMTLEEGKKLVESLPDTEAMWVTPDGDIFYSSGFEKYITKYY